MHLWRLQLKHGKYSYSAIDRCSANKDNDKTAFFSPTLTKKYVFWQIPESRLDHIKVPTAHTVHERRQEVGCQAATQETKQLQL